MGKERGRISIQSLRRDSKQCVEGSKAYENGISIDDCPYQTGSKKRMTWMTGWYDARTYDRLGHIFRNRKVVWP